MRHAEAFCAVFTASADAVIFDDVVHVLIAAAGKVDQHGAFTHGLGQLHAVGYGVGAVDGGNDAFQAGQGEESVDGCKLSIERTFEITISYDSGAYNSNQTSFTNFRLDFEFVKCFRYSFEYRYESNIKSFR